MVPPGAVFSFNQSVGPTTVAAGYQVGYGITIRGGQAVTVPSEAGGICQVATTIFHAAFWAGFSIVERQGHLYWIPRYGQPPRGMKGLDATVDDPWVDFKFRNTSPDWLLVEAGTSGTTLRFALRGTKPDWEVKVEPPVIWGIVKAARETVRQEDPSMPAGRELAIESAEDGFSSRVRRTVVRGDEVLDTTEITSFYRPSRNVLLVGTKGLTPTPTPASTPVGTETPGAATPATPEAPAATATATPGP
jgi:vancomycin resistance protein YoaR